MVENQKIKGDWLSWLSVVLAGVICLLIALSVSGLLEGAKEHKECQASPKIDLKIAATRTWQGGFLNPQGGETTFAFPDGRRSVAEGVWGQVGEVVAMQPCTLLWVR